MKPAPDCAPAGRIILALDAPDAASALRLLDPLDGRLVWAKIGLQLFVAEGPDIVRKVRARGLRVFLDLKLHDIPNTVRGAVASARDLGAELLTIHLAGGPAMAQAALEAAGPIGLLGVTVLTSMDAAQLAACGVNRPPGDQVTLLAEMGRSAGLRGLVASPREIRALRKACGPDMTLVIPGIRPAGSAVGDQSRIATPREALADGADFLVIGRPISGAPDPAAAFDAIVSEIEG